MSEETTKEPAKKPEGSEDTTEQQLQDLNIVFEGLDLVDEYNPAIKALTNRINQLEEQLVK